MRNEFTVVIDACVLVQYHLCDTLLRLAETPPLYAFCWSHLILEESKRTLITKLEWPEHLANSWDREVRKHFAECQVENFEPLIESMTNHEKDRHVVAAAVKAGAETIVTINLKHFRAQDLKRWDIEAQHPDVFLCHLYSLNPALVRENLTVQATRGGRDLSDLLQILDRIVPQFADTVYRDH